MSYWCRYCQELAILTEYNKTPHQNARPSSRAQSEAPALRACSLLLETHIFFPLWRSKKASTPKHFSVFSKKFNCSLHACLTKNPKTPAKQQTQRTKTHGNFDRRANINFHLPLPIWIRFLTWLCQESYKNNCPAPPSNRNYTSNRPQCGRIILALKNSFLAWNYISPDWRDLLHGDKTSKCPLMGSQHLPRDRWTSRGSSQEKRHC